MAALMAVQQQKISQSQDTKSATLEAIGSKALEAYSLFEDDVLLATYIAPEKSVGGIIRPGRNIDEDRFQGKCGLLLKVGPTAFVYNRSSERAFEGTKPEINSWVVYRPSDGWEISLNGVSCRLIRANMLRGMVTDPSVVW